MLDSAIKDQLKGLFAQLEAHYTFDIFVHPQHESRAELVDLLEEVASCSDKLSCRLQDSEGLKFILLKEGKDTGITFRAVPGGHEFTSLLMAVLNADGKGKNFPDEFITRRIKALQGPISLTTYLSLTCTNCPDVVQALNMMVLLNGQIRHEAVDGSINEEEVELDVIESEEEFEKVSKTFEEIFDDEEEESAHTGVKVHKKTENSASDTVFRDC